MQFSTSINLIKRKANLLDEALKWALSIGRLLIIITEFVAFSTFIYRFSLDRTLIDLNSKIKQEQAIVESLKDRENQYRNLQERIAVASKINSTGDKNVQILNDIVEFTPAEITFNSFSIKKEEIKIEGVIGSVSSLSNFMNSLREYKQISSVNIDSIKNQSETNSLTVVLTAKLKEDSNEIK